MRLHEAACGASSGIVPVGPETYSVSEMRAEAIGGSARAADVALGEAAGFYQHQGLGGFAQPAARRRSSRILLAYRPCCYIPVRRGGRLLHRLFWRRDSSPVTR